MAAAPLLMASYRTQADIAVPYSRYSSPAFPAFSPYDSDNEPLLPSHHRAPLSHYPYTPHTYSQHMYAAPQFVNTRLTDDSIIPAIVVDVIPKEREHHEPEDDRNHHGRRSGLLRRVMHKDKKGKGNGGEQDSPRRITKVVYMPRKEYVLLHYHFGKSYHKWFARGHGGEYIGTEPHKRWTEEELEATFGRYRPPVNRKSGIFWGRG
ncbi:hypothetical protein CJF32_00000478 [Rutstroemia sp. NJR-2017a WRK4]|nr:hypothetical protein CJF32_00000478 [Rutstroemia sp. NJR-2017a WRK4]